jgi:hypothetical protein
LLTVVVACTVLLSGCGQERPEINDRVARTLQRDVVAVKAAVDESRWEEARTALDRLETHAADAAASGNISDDRAARILAIRQRVLDDLDQITRSDPSLQPSTTPGAESTPSPEPKVSETAEPDEDDEDDHPSDEEDKGKDKGGHNKDKGEGKGHGKS